MLIVKVQKSNHVTMMPKNYSLLTQERLTHTKFLFQGESREGLQKHFESGLHV